ncbi:tyrosyl-tRNA synthetase [Paramicrobacterium agarici]|nr:tyrosine--tRNA ligase [Microbacterium agarici]TQO24141.1 tyrosyl-tRNA synthetase [Microbacterium agarici]
MRVSNPVLSHQANDAAFEDIWDELLWRGLIQVSTDQAALKELLAGEPITYYCGFDPTAASLHLGHLVQLLTLRRLQLAGHKPLSLVGGSTGLVGDPRPSAERTLQTKETVSEWVDSLKAQIENYLSFDGENRARMVNNLDWTGDLTAIDFLRDVGKHFRVGNMLKKDAVSARLNSEAGISFTEFSYQLLQALDFLELYRRYDCVLQTGGSDQWGNLVGGTDLVHRVEGTSVHAFGTPLIVNSDGTKFGKSEGNAIWLNPEMTTPYAFYQFWVNAADADVIDRLKVFTFLSRAEIEDYAVKVETEPFKREAQKRLAWEVTSLVHGKAAAQAAIDAADALFGRGDLSTLDERTLESALSELPGATAAPGSSVAQLLVDTELTKSLGEARRAIDQGGVYVNNEKVTEPDAVAEALLHRRFLVLRRGKKTLAGVTIQA